MRELNPLPPLIFFALTMVFIAADIVTETDQAVETLIAARLRVKYPSFEFIGEETYAAGTKIKNTPTFIVDPIDGTSNFVHGFPAVCISLGLVVEKQPTIGVVYNPFVDLFRKVLVTKLLSLSLKTLKKLN